METVTVPTEEFKQMKRELQTLRKSKLYKRLLEFEQHVAERKTYSRKDLGF